MNELVMIVMVMFTMFAVLKCVHFLRQICVMLLVIIEYIEREKGKPR